MAYKSSGTGEEFVYVPEPGSEPVIEAYRSSVDAQSLNKALRGKSYKTTREVTNLISFLGLPFYLTETENVYYIRFKGLKSLDNFALNSETPQEDLVAGKLIKLKDIQPPAINETTELKVKEVLEENQLNLF